MAVTGSEFEAYRQLGYHIGTKALQSAEAIAVEKKILTSEE